MDSGTELKEKPQQRDIVGVIWRVAERYLIRVAVVVLALLVAFFGGFASTNEPRGSFWLGMFVVMIVVAHVAAVLVWLRRKKSKQTKSFEAGSPPRK